MSRTVSALDERAALEALEVQRGLAAFTSVATPADRKAATQGNHTFYSKLYTGLARTAWPCESACVINTLIDHRPFLPFSTSCKQPHAHFLGTCRNSCNKATNCPPSIVSKCQTPASGS